MTKIATSNLLWILCLLLSSVLLPGCPDEGDDDDDTTGSPLEDPHNDGNDSEG